MKMCFLAHGCIIGTRLMWGLTPRAIMTRHSVGVWVLCLCLVCISSADGRVLQWLKHRQLSDTVVLVSWKVNPGQALSWNYKVSYTYRLGQIGDCQPLLRSQEKVLETAGPWQRTLTVSGLKPWRSYRYKLKASKQFFRKEDILTGVFPTRPTEVARRSVLHVRAHNVSATSAELSWQEPPCRDRNGPLRRFDVELTTGPHAHVVLNAYTGLYVLVGNLRPATSYLVRVRYVNSVGPSAFTDPLKLTTTAGGLSQETVSAGTGTPMKKGSTSKQKATPQSTQHTSAASKNRSRRPSQTTDRSFLRKSSPNQKKSLHASATNNKKFPTNKNSRKNPSTNKNSPRNPSTNEKSPHVLATKNGSPSTFASKEKYLHNSPSEKNSVLVSNGKKANKDASRTSADNKDVSQASAVNKDASQASADNKDATVADDNVPRGSNHGKSVPRSSTAFKNSAVKASITNNGAGKASSAKGDTPQASAAKKNAARASIAKDNDAQQYVQPASTAKSNSPGASAAKNNPAQVYNDNGSDKKKGAVSSAKSDKFTQGASAAESSPQQASSDKSDAPQEEEDPQGSISEEKTPQGKGNAPYAKSITRGGGSTAEGGELGGSAAAAAVDGTLRSSRSTCGTEDNPCAPFDLQQVSNSPTCVSIKWMVSSVDVISAFDVYDCTHDDNVNHLYKHKTSPPSSVQRVQLCGLEPGKYYVFGVRSRTASNNYSNLVTIRTHTHHSAPPKPSAPQLLLKSTTTVQINVQGVSSSNGPVTSYYIVVEAMQLSEEEKAEAGIPSSPVGYYKGQPLMPLTMSVVPVENANKDGTLALEEGRGSGDGSQMNQHYLSPGQGDREGQQTLATSQNGRLGPAFPANSQTGRLGPAFPANSQNGRLGQMSPANSQNGGLGQMSSANSQNGGLGQMPSANSQNGGLGQMPSANSQNGGLGQAFPTNSQSGRLDQAFPSNAPNGRLGQMPPANSQNRRLGQMPPSNSQKELMNGISTANSPNKGQRNRQNANGQLGTSSKLPSGTKGQNGDLASDRLPIKDLNSLNQGSADVNPARRRNPTNINTAQTDASGRVTNRKSKAGQVSFAGNPNLETSAGRSSEVGLLNGRMGGLFRAPPENNNRVKNSARQLRGPVVNHTETAAPRQRSNDKDKNPTRLSADKSFGVQISSEESQTELNKPSKSSAKLGKETERGPKSSGNRNLTGSDGGNTESGAVNMYDVSDLPTSLNLGAENTTDYEKKIRIPFLVVKQAVKPRVYQIEGQWKNGTDRAAFETDDSNVRSDTYSFLRVTSDKEMKSSAGYGPVRNDGGRIFLQPTFTLQKVTPQKHAKPQRNSNVFHPPTVSVKKTDYPMTRKTHGNFAGRGKVTWETSPAAPGARDGWKPRVFYQPLETLPSGKQRVNISSTNIINRPSTDEKQTKTTQDVRREKTNKKFVTRTRNKIGLNKPRVKNNEAGKFPSINDFPKIKSSEVSNRSDSKDVNVQTSTKTGTPNSKQDVAQRTSGSLGTITLPSSDAAPTLKVLSSKQRTPVTAQTTAGTANSMGRATGGKETKNGADEVAGTSETTVDIEPLGVSDTESKVLPSKEKLSKVVQGTGTQSQFQNTETRVQGIPISKSKHSDPGPEEANAISDSTGKAHTIRYGEQIQSPKTRATEDADKFVLTPRDKNSKPKQELSRNSDRVTTIRPMQRNLDMSETVDGPTNKAFHKVNSVQEMTPSTPSADDRKMGVHVTTATKRLPVKEYDQAISGDVKPRSGRLGTASQSTTSQDTGMPDVAPESTEMSIPQKAANLATEFLVIVPDSRTKLTAGKLDVAPDAASKQRIMAPNVATETTANTKLGTTTFTPKQTGSTSNTALINNVTDLWPETSNILSRKRTQSTPGTTEVALPERIQTNSVSFEATENVGVTQSNTTTVMSEDIVYQETPAAKLGALSPDIHSFQSSGITRKPTTAYKLQHTTTSQTTSPQTNPNTTLPYYSTFTQTQSPGIVSSSTEGRTQEDDTFPEITGQTENKRDKLLSTSKDSWNQVGEHKRRRNPGLSKHDQTEEKTQSTKRQQSQEQEMMKELEEKATRTERELSSEKQRTSKQLEEKAPQRSKRQNSQTQQALGQLGEKKALQRFKLPNSRPQQALEQYAGGGTTPKNPAMPPGQIVAELKRVGMSGLTFTIGDGKVYNGFVNSPLSSSGRYKIYTVVNSEVETTLYSVSNPLVVSMPLEPTVSQLGASGRRNNYIVIGIMCSVAFLLTLVMIWLKFLQYSDRTMLASAQCCQCCMCSVPDHFFMLEGDYSRNMGGLGPKSPLLQLLGDPHMQNCERHWSQTFSLSEPRTIVTGRELIPQEQTPFPFPNPDRPVGSEPVTFHKEFQSLPRPNPANSTLAGKRHPELNNTPNVLPFDATRVVLDHDGTGGADYINASFITGYLEDTGTRTSYIAAQCPFDQATALDLWRLVVQQGVGVVVVLSKVIEDGALRCLQFWPEMGTQEKGPFVIQTLDQFTYAHYRETVVSVQQKKWKGHQELLVRLFCFTSWPDHGVPKDAIPLVELCTRVHKCQGSSERPVLVQCDTGSGRTAVFIAVDILLAQYAAEHQASVYEVVCALRSERPFMVQLYPQYLYVYDAVVEEMHAGDTWLSPQPRERYSQLAQHNPNTGHTYLTDQFILLNVMLGQYRAGEGVIAPNPSANVPDVIPAVGDPRRLPNVNFNSNVDHWPFEDGLKPEEEDSMVGLTSVVFVDGFRRKCQFIMLKTPLPGSVVDFWRHVYDNDVRTIVMMQDLDQYSAGGPGHGQYWPTLGSRAWEPFLVELLDTRCDHDLTIRSLRLHHTHRTRDEYKEVKQFQFHGWNPSTPSTTSQTQPKLLPPPPQNARGQQGSRIPSFDPQWTGGGGGGGQECPLSNTRSTLLTLYNMVKQWQEEVTVDSTPILVHCKNGAQCSGLYVALSLMVARMDEENLVSVYRVCRSLRKQCPWTIGCLEQYKFLHKLLWDHLTTHRNEEGHEDWAPFDTMETDQREEGPWHGVMEMCGHSPTEEESGNGYQSGDFYATPKSGKDHQQQQQYMCERVELTETEEEQTGESATRVSDHYSISTFQPQPLHHTHPPPSPGRGGGGGRTPTTTPLHQNNHNHHHHHDGYRFSPHTLPRSRSRSGSGRAPPSPATTPLLSSRPPRQERGGGMEMRCSPRRLSSSPPRTSTRNRPRSSLAQPSYAPRYPNQSPGPSSSPSAAAATTTTTRLRTQSLSPIRREQRQQQQQQQQQQRPPPPPKPLRRATPLRRRSRDDYGTPTTTTTTRKSFEKKKEEEEEEEERERNEEEVEEELERWWRRSSTTTTSSADEYGGGGGGRDGRRGSSSRGGGGGKGVRSEKVVKETTEVSRGRGEGVLMREEVVDALQDWSTSTKSESDDY